MFTDNKYYALRFRKTDALHKHGDILNCVEKALYIGQTPECELTLPHHPEYADCCYAVIVREAEGWSIIRQEPDADVTVNGSALDLIAKLSDGNRIAFDNTLVEFSVADGTPRASYVTGGASYWLWSIITVIALALCAVIYYMANIDLDVYSTFEAETADIYRVRADSLIVLKNNQPIDTISLGQKHVGTGFVTDDGYFVTARHCVEFWLAEEDELKTNYSEIDSKAVRYAIEAESDTTLTLISKVTIISNDSASAKTFSSKDFLIDKSNDLIYEYGTIAHPYLWRSVVSKYENRRAELGDVAVMKWDAPGTIHLDDCTAPLPPDATLYGFGYPQGEKAATDVKYQSGRLFDYNSHNKYDCFTCNAEFNKGLSGGPVFILRKSSLHHSNEVVGITSRIADKGTLCVPSAQIRKLINILSKDGKRQ